MKEFKTLSVTVTSTFRRYYKVAAGSKEEAVRKILSGEEDLIEEVFIGTSIPTSSKYFKIET